MVAGEVLERHGASEHHHVERELLRPEVVVEEVHGEHEQSRQQRLLAVKDRGDIEYVFSEKVSNT